MFVSSSPPIGRRRNREQFEEDISQPDLPPHSKSVRPNTLVPDMHTFRRSPRKHPSGNQRIATSSLAQLRQAHQTAPPLPKSTSYWFKKKLFTVSWIKPDHKKLQMGCTQPNCNYTQDTANNKIGGSGNLVRHYESKHRSIPATDKADKAQEPQRVVQQADFFAPSFPGERDQRMRNLLLNFFVQNNLSFRIVDQLSFREFVEYLSARTTLPSRRDLCRDLKATFEKTQNVIKAKLQEHIKAGGRVSITTDTWSAKNRKEFMAITVHYVDRNTFENISNILDVILLTEPFHSGKYMSKKLYEVTEFFGITMAVFTCSRDNAKPNDCLLHDFEKKVQEQYENLDDHEQAQYYLRFRISSGDIRCFAHIINLAVQVGKESLRTSIFMSHGCTNIMFTFCCSAEDT
jgi:hypothetical protein